MKKILFFLNLAVINIITLPCFATSELYAGNEELNEIANNNMFTPSYFKMFLGLAFVIGLIYLTGIIYQKLTKVRMSNSTEDRFKPEIISTTTLGQNKNLHVIKVMNEYILIGSTQTNITFLKNLGENNSYRGY